MERGLYEQLVTQDLHSRLTARRGSRRVPSRLMQPIRPTCWPGTLRRQCSAVLAATRDPERRLAIVNALVDSLEEAHGNSVVAPARQLLLVRGLPEPGPSSLLKTSGRPRHWLMQRC